MSSKYQIGDERYAHFVTFTVVNWIDVFTRNEYRNVIIDSLNYCVQNRGLSVHAFCIMTNHVHLIVSSKEGVRLSFIIRDLKKYTSNTLLKAIAKNDLESKREWMLWMFERTGMKNRSNDKYQFWQNGYHPVELSNDRMVKQRLYYIHDNPVRAGFVLSAEEYTYSSASNYSGKKERVMEIDLLGDGRSETEKYGTPVPAALRLAPEPNNYIHDNPLRAGFVLSAEEYLYSSAANYSGKKECVMEIDLLGDGRSETEKYWTPVPAALRLAPESIFSYVKVIEAKYFK